MLGSVRHDRPECVAAWIEQTSQTEDTPAERLLNNLYKPDEAVARVLLDALPHVNARVNAVLLHALRWQATRYQMPKVVQDGALSHLAVWLQEESDADLLEGLLAVLGHWRFAPQADAEILLY